MSCPRLGSCTSDSALTCQAGRKCGREGRIVRQRRIGDYLASRQSTCAIATTATVARPLPQREKVCRFTRYVHCCSLASKDIHSAKHVRILCLSNGHGEDVIGARIAESLKTLLTDSEAVSWEVAALPLVGLGAAYEAAGIQLIGSTQQMPSGGFVYMNGSALARDVKAGLVQLTLGQLETIKEWAEADENSSSSLLLAVGDLLPLVMSWLGGRKKNVPYAFVGCAKSEFYLRRPNGELLDRAESFLMFRSVYYPWERAFLNAARCRLIMPRDKLTADVLQGCLESGSGVKVCNACKW